MGKTIDENLRDVSVSEDLGETSSCDSPMLHLCLSDSHRAFSEFGTSLNTFYKLKSSRNSIQSKRFRNL
jgi:hypothetical protein